MTRPRLVVIAGPTAAGKSALALELALRHGGEIVNADSRQVYRGMEIGTAAPARAERALVPHHLFGIAAPEDGYSLALFQRDARAVLDATWTRGAFPWLVGGTGQYVWALLEAWAVPEVPPDEALRAELAEFADEHGPDALLAELRAIDPVSADGIDPRNVRRVIRAIEVTRHTGRPFSDARVRGDPGFDFRVLGVDLPNETLHARIDARVVAMFERGFVDEVRALLADGVPPGSAAMDSIGYSQVIRHLDGEITLAEAVAETQRATRQLARRQRQWFRHTDARITWVGDVDEAWAAVSAFVSGEAP
ncbi:MAG: tRNA (adenosine(37)-N6)-dimethylallyltransferase MiaA [Dehalococcoidia bacterium]|nr:tRNA (adenosine(37)-N6)-dimethylallyltransferase MiaA [Dehalococcoidia bacterium]